MAKKISARKLLFLLGSSSVIFYVLSGLSSLLNYALYPVLSRLVSVDQYGEVQFLLSSFNQLSVGFVVLNILAVIITASATNKASQKESLGHLNIVAGLIALIIALFGIGALLILMPNLQLTSPLAIIFTGIALVLNVPYTILLGKLQGNGLFIKSGVVGLVATAGKFIFSIAFVIAGLGVAGAMLGVALGMGLSLLLGYIYSEKSPAQKHSFKERITGLSHLKFTAAIGLFSVTILTILSTVDSLISRIILDTHQAGMYAAVATLAKIILAATAPLVWLALPPAIQGEKKQVRRYVYATVLIVGAFLLIFNISPATIIQLATSIDAGVYAQLLPFASVTMGMYALAFITTAIFVCTNRLKPLLAVYIASLSSFFVSLYLLTGSFTEPTMFAVIASQLVAGLAITVPLCWLLFLKYRDLQ